MTRRQRDLTADERKLWRRVAASVKTRRASPPETDEVEERPAARRIVASPPAKTAPRTTVAKAPPDPQDRGNERRVRRGKLEIGAKLDLHGHTQDSARSALGRFLRASQRRGDRTVIVITGVGRTGEGVLKKRLPEWLASREIAALISGYAPAHRSHGGAGAFYVFLKRAD